MKKAKITKSHITELDVLQVAMMPKKELLEWEDYNNSSNSKEGYTLLKWTGYWSAYAPGSKLGSDDRIDGKGYETREDAKHAAEVHFATSKL